MRSNRPQPQTPPTRRDAHLAYIPGLDGLRALAVIAVLLYHAGLPIRGGFGGVESFFVLSGFLITALLLVEWRQHGRIDLPAFWLRRARRLMPALLFMLAGTLVFATLMLRGDRAELGGDALAALVYVMNWRLIASGQSYFDPLVRPPLLQNLWSLAVEEQFYLLWPLLFAAGTRMLRRSGLLAVTLAGAAASTLLMAWLYQPGADPSRLYYGTDTRVAPLLIGAALAMVWTPGSVPASTNRRLGLLLDGVGVLALGGLIACFVWLSTRHPLLYRGGFALIALMTVIVIAAATHPRGRLVNRLLGWHPLRWIGLRSYAIYLWHWPIFMVTRPGLDLPLDGLPLLVLRLAIVGIIVEVSYRFVELPVRHGALSRATPWLVTAAGAGYRALTRRIDARSRLLVLLATCLLLVIVVSMTVDDVPLDTVSADFAAPTRSVPNVMLAAVTPTAPPGTATAPAGDLAASPTTLPGPDARGTLVPDGTTAEPARPSATPAPTRPALDPGLVAVLQRVLDDTLADGYIPGAVLSVGIPGYQPWSGASGLADRARDLRMQPDTLVHLASVSKMFTAVVVLQLVEEQRIDLDAPSDTYLPGLVRFGSSTTVRNLLNHTSGIYDYQEDTQFFIEAYENPESTYTPAEIVARADQAALAFRPGTPGAWRYSSTNYVILGMLVEQVTGRSLAQEMRERIFAPLGLDHTFFAPQEPPTGTVAQGYIGGSDQVDLSMTFAFATGNIVSTASDLRQFAEGLFGGRLLGDNQLATMLTVIETGGAYDMPELQYGLGVMKAHLNVGPGPDGNRRPDAISTVLGHIGGIAGFRTAVWRVPESGITIALSLNQAGIDPNLLARDTLDAILAWQGQ